MKSMKYIEGVSTLKFDHDKCTGCARCAEVCPHGIFEVESGKARVLDADMCMGCGACAGNCSFGALRVEPGVGCAFAIINSMLYGGAPSCDCSGEDGAGDSGGSVCC